MSVTVRLGGRDRYVGIVVVLAAWIVLVRWLTSTTDRTGADSTRTGADSTPIGAESTPIGHLTMSRIAIMPSSSWLRMWQCRTVFPV